MISSDFSELIAKVDYGKISSYDVCERDVKLMCLEAERYGINTVVIQPAYLSYVAELRKKIRLKKVASVCAYPFGAYPPSIKEQEIVELINIGIDEIYMLLAVGSLLDSNYLQIAEEIKMLVSIADGRNTKLILEMSALNDNQLGQVVELAIREGIDFLVTSTGFKPNKMEAPSLERMVKLREKCEHEIGLVVNGSFYSKEELLYLLNSGIDRVFIENLSLFEN